MALTSVCCSRDLGCRTGPSGGARLSAATGWQGVGDGAGVTREGERFDDFDIHPEWWTGDALPDAKVVRRGLAGVPRVEVAGLSKEKVEELFWDTITQVRFDLTGILWN
jgi:hypothetical protein